MPTYAIYFVKEFQPGEHWRQDAKADDSDRRQHWRVGDLWSVGTSVANPLPAHFAAKEIPPPQPGDVWDPATRVFVSPPAKVYANPSARLLADAGFLDAAEFLERR